MDQVLVYSDSLSWGIVPGTRQRLPFDQRWPGIFEASLNDDDPHVRVIENCLNGRTTIWSDPVRPGRNGSEGLAQVIEMHSPLKLVVLLLGTNDFQVGRANNASSSAAGIAKLIRIIKEAPVEPGIEPPAMLVVAPPQITNPTGDMAAKFSGAEERSKGLSQEIERVAHDEAVRFFDSNTVIASSAIDGVHLDKQQHQILGKALATEVLETTTEHGGHGAEFAHQAKRPRSPLGPPPWTTTCGRT
ncbi:SGNH/GDSL hydrolase family protein [Marinobacteraceae bacterium S3BR75-40.1]